MSDNTVYPTPPREVNIQVTHDGVDSASIKMLSHEDMSTICIALMGMSRRALIQVSDEGKERASELWHQIASQFPHFGREPKQSIIPETARVRPAFDYTFLSFVRDAIRGAERGQCCWCDVAIGHPLMDDHSQSCKNLGSALTLLERVLAVQQTPKSPST